MASLKMGFYAYMEETALHGFKYLGKPSSVGSKCFWFLAILSSIALGGWQIGTGIMDWEENPAVTTIDSIHTPIKSVQFPTITFCRNDHTHLDEWELVEHVFNFFEFRCKSEDCANAQKLRKDFKPFLTRCYQYVKDSIQEVDSPEDWSDRVNQTIVAILRNLTTMTELEEKYISTIGTYHSYKFWQMFIEPLECENEPLQECDDECKEIGENISLLFEVADSLQLPDTFGAGVGTFLRKYSHLIGVTFSDSETYLELSLCDEINDVEKKIHHVMLQLGSQMGENVSLLDLPKFFKSMSVMKSGNPVAIYNIPRLHPVFSYCNGNYNKSEEFIFDRYPNDIVQKSSNYLPVCYYYWYNEEQELVHNPNEEHPNHFCSRVAPDFTGKNHLVIMKTMKFAYHMATAEDLKQLYTDMAASDLPYKLRPLEDVTAREYLSFAWRPHITLMVNGKIKESDIQPTLTTQGLCYAWNAKSISQVFENSTFLENADKAFLSHKQRSSGLIWNGSLHNVAFVLNQWESFFPDRTGNDGHFTFTINDGKSNIDMTFTTFSAMKRKHIVARVLPQEVSSDQDVMGVELNKRKCRFEQEKTDNMTLFQEYSMANCITGCMIQVSAAHCHCIPWDVVNTSDSRLCDAFGSSCFFKEMKNETKHEAFCSHCLPDCNSVKFTAIFAEVEMRTPDFCNNENMAFAASVYMPTNYTGEYYDYCDEALKNDFAIVEFQMEAKTYTTMKQSLKISNLEKVGSVGGSLGFFTGFSVLAIFELVYWIAVTGQGAMADRRKRRPSCLSH